MTAYTWVALLMQWVGQDFVLAQIVFKFIDAPSGQGVYLNEITVGVPL
jgi:hypothetical protein